MSQRGQFSSKAGFIMAAAGSAVGLGNIWGFPTQAASHGGAAFVLVYLIAAFLMAYPALMAELIIGRHARANVVSALGRANPRPAVRLLGRFTGYYGVAIASLILSFYAIVAGWMLAHLGQPIATALGADSVGQWLSGDSHSRNLLGAATFSAITIAVVSQGVEQGIEKWSSRLMPLLIAILLLLIGYVFTREGAVEGLRVYLLPDLARATDPKLILNATGQAFFSLSLGVGTMLIYGSYLSREENLPRIGAWVTLIDVSIAFIAGLLIIPALYVAQAQGVTIFDDSGQLIAGPSLILQVLPSLFTSMGDIGLVIAAAFFGLMSIAALTSSISMLEVPVSCAVEQTGAGRARITLLVGAIIFALSSLIIFNFEPLFGWVIELTTVYSQPLLGMIFCLFAGWAYHRNTLLEEIKQGDDCQIEQQLFWKIWPFYVRFICPLLICACLIQSLL